VSYTFNFNAFIPGACTPAECFVDFYDAEDCGDTPENPGNPVTSTDCFNVELIGL
jgi:hypothetical protein